MKKWNFFSEFKREKRSRRILFNYTLLQVPSLVLVILIVIFLNRWTALPLYVLWGIMILWIIKDIILFPLVWRAYDWNRQDSSHPMIGRRGVAQEHLAPSGYIRVQGELWLAELAEKEKPIQKGESVQVCAINGLKLFVKRVVEKCTV
jgi:membrane protein implicated in regulation of membrane protease activity